MPSSNGRGRRRWPTGRSLPGPDAVGGAPVSRGLRSGASWACRTQVDVADEQLDVVGSDVADEQLDVVGSDVADEQLDVVGSDVADEQLDVVGSDVADEQLDLVRLDVADEQLGLVRLDVANEQLDLVRLDVAVVPGPDGRAGSGPSVDPDLMWVSADLGKPGDPLGYQVDFEPQGWVPRPHSGYCRAEWHLDGVAGCDNHVAGQRRAAVVVGGSVAGSEAQPDQYRTLAGRHRQPSVPTGVAGPAGARHGDGAVVSLNGHAGHGQLGGQPRCFAAVGNFLTRLVHDEHPPVLQDSPDVQYLCCHCAGGPWTAHDAGNANELSQTAG